MLPIRHLSGAAFALAAGLLWGLVFIAPLLLPDYPAALQSFGRYVAFGLIALPLAWADRRVLAQFTRADWVDAMWLGLIGNIVYYLFLASAIQHAGAPLPTMVIGTLPVVIAICSNLRDGARDGRLPWLKLLPSLVVIAAGIACVNHAELAQLRASSDATGATGPAQDAHIARYVSGGLLALGGVVCWTWYPLRNADWLRAHPDRSPRAWATAQGVATLPMALLGYMAYCVYSVYSAYGAGPVAGAAVGAADAAPNFPLPFGPRPQEFLALMFAIGLLASWLGTLCWNEASQRLPTTLVGQLIVFETLAALAYAFMLRGQWPAPITAAGIALLVAGVLWALRVRPEPLPAAASHHA